MRHAARLNTPLRKQKAMRTIEPATQSRTKAPSLFSPSHNTHPNHNFLFRNPSQQASPTSRHRFISSTTTTNKILPCATIAPFQPNTHIRTTDQSFLRTYVPSNPMLGSTAQTLAAQGRRQGRLRYAHQPCDKSMRWKRFASPMCIVFFLHLVYRSNREPPWDRSCQRI